MNKREEKRAGRGGGTTGFHSGSLLCRGYHRNLPSMFPVFVVQFVIFVHKQ